MKRQVQSAKRTIFPITAAILGGMRQSWQQNPNPKDAVMPWAAASMCFFGFLRVGKITCPSEKLDAAYHLAHGDVQVNDYAYPRFVVMSIKASKKDPFRRVYVRRTNREFFLVAAVLGYMVQRGGKDGPFFTFEDGRLLARVRFVCEVRKALTKLGIQQCDACRLHFSHCGSDYDGQE